MNKFAIDERTKRAKELNEIKKIYDELNRAFIDYYTKKSITLQELKNIAQCSKSLIDEFEERVGYTTSLTDDIKMFIQRLESKINEIETRMREQGNKAREMENYKMKEMILSACKINEFYSLSKKMGTCIILNHETYNEKTWKKKMKPRKGTDKDVNSLETFFKKYGFDVKVYNDKKVEEIKNILDDARNEIHADASCFVLCVLTHGNLDEGTNKEILCAYDYAYPSEALFSPFLGDNCPSLTDKPKLFFIQACRGEEYDGGTEVRFKFDSPDSDGEQDSEQLDNSDRFTKSLIHCEIQLYADVFIAYSTVSGTKSWRNEEKGVWFIQNLCETLEHRAKNLDLAAILTIVCQKVSYNHKSKTGKKITSNKKQVPSIYTTLTKRFMFPKPSC